MCNLQMWQSLFVSLSLIYNPYLDSGPKLAIMLALLAISIPCYFIFEKVGRLCICSVSTTRLLINDACANQITKNGASSQGDAFAPLLD